MTSAQVRRHIVVDVESTGLELHHQTTEVAWYDLDTDEYDHFFVPHTLDDADPVALDLSGYHDRIAGQPVDDGTKLKKMHDRLGGDAAKTTLWGANPGFDVRSLMGLFARQNLPTQPWDHRVLDPCVALYWYRPDAFPFGEVPGLKPAAELLGVPMSHHEALADVLTTVAIVREVNKMREALLETSTSR